MIPRTKAEFSRILAGLPGTPRSVLEVGALPSDSALLTCPELADAPRRVGINLMLAGDAGGAPVLRMDARRLAFDDASFDLVISSSTLEHVPDFWLACAEMKRVLAPGGTLVLSTPGFDDSRAGRGFRRLGFRLGLPDLFKRSTLTMRIHDAPHDYYRFSPYAYRSVMLDGLEDVRVWSCMTPPRLFGTGRKPAGNGRAA